MVHRMRVACKGAIVSIHNHIDEGNEEVKNAKEAVKAENKKKS